MGTEHYRKHLGSARASLKRVVAGSTVDLRVTYRAGKFGVDDSGGLMVVGRFASDCAALQFDDPAAPNYVRITASNPAVGFRPRYGPKIHRRPWGKGFEAKLTGGYLRPGDQVRFDFRRWRFQTFCEPGFELKVLVDPIATCEYVELPRSPEIEVVSGPPVKLVLAAPSQVAAGKRFAIGVKVEDKWGNPCRGAKSTVHFKAAGALRGLPRSVKLKRGAARIAGLRLVAGGIFSISARCGKLRARSNPIRARRAPKLGRYWADLHAQSEETVGSGTVEDYFAFARDYAFLDVASHQGNDFQITKAFWKRLNAVTRRFNRAGRFVTFPGYEWSGNTGLGGDRNVLHVTEGGPLSRSSHALLDDLSDQDSDSSTAAQLFRRLRGRKSLVFAHVGGRFANMDFHDGAVERAVEVHSAWGTFEWLLFDALKRGYRVGVVANSDGHKCRPGASHPGAGRFGSYGGLTCILAEKLARREVFAAVRARHTYGTTGARIGLDVELVRGGKTRAIMGDAVRAARSDRLKVSVVGTAPVERVELYNGKRRFATRFPETAGARPAVKLLWAGSEVRGRARLVSWDGELKASGRIRRFETVNFLNPEKRVRRAGPGRLCWEGVTTGGAQGVILHLEGPAGNIDFRTGRKSVKIGVAALTRRPRVWRAGGLDARVEAYLTPAGGGPGVLEFEVPLKNLKRGDNPIFVKVVQRDGHLAWSSPIYVLK